ncbi:hypothetical protein INT43_004826 [Umbelopsis isabellina]|uniref:Uncharacterized protein n=1 Tax=Mortierella isabellina TaxID=91625 RepID=A0A8H7PEN9_MORIS|nr:hypothetical protein INT43_004826 [Umbelopsis isabellina]
MVSNLSIFVADLAGQDLLAKLRNRYFNPCQAHLVRTLFVQVSRRYLFLKPLTLISPPTLLQISQFTMPLRSTGKPPLPEIGCNRTAWIVSDTTTVQVNADLIIGKNHADNFDNDMHGGPAGLRQVNKGYEATARRLAVSGLITTANSAPSGILDTSRLPLAVFIFAAVAMLT